MKDFPSAFAPLSIFRIRKRIVINTPVPIDISWRTNGKEHQWYFPYRGIAFRRDVVSRRKMMGKRCLTIFATTDRSFLGSLHRTNASTIVPVWQLGARYVLYYSTIWNKIHTLWRYVMIVVSWFEPHHRTLFQLSLDHRMGRSLKISKTGRWNVGRLDHVCSSQG